MENINYKPLIDPGNKFPAKINEVSKFMAFSLQCFIMIGNEIESQSYIFLALAFIRKADLCREGL